NQDDRFSHASGSDLGASPDVANEIEQEDRAGGRDGNRSDHVVRRDAEQPEHEPAEQRSDDADDQIAGQPKSGSAHDLAGQPAGHDSDEEEIDDPHATSSP